MYGHVLKPDLLQTQMFFALSVVCLYLVSKMADEEIVLKAIGIDVLLLVLCILPAVTLDMLSQRSTLRSFEIYKGILLLLGIVLSEVSVIGTAVIGR